MNAHIAELVRVPNDVGISYDEHSCYLRASIEIQDVRENLIKKIRGREKYE